MTNAKEIKKHLKRNLLILAVSVAAAIFLAGSGFFEKVLIFSQTTIILGSFVAGFFYTSVITIGPAMVAIGTLAQHNSIWIIALAGAIGSVLGDFIIFKFVRDTISDDFLSLFGQPRVRRVVHLLHLEVFRFLTPFIGALIVASPLPDELGLAMMGIAKIKNSVFLLFSFAANFIGILAVSLVGQSF
ncbi:MAG: hypothetical protein AAB646_01710 [Patescibacteria group bacterium]